MDRFIVLTSIAEQTLANSTCEALEEAGIPVILEHREIVDGNQRACGYRVFVPVQHQQAALKLANAASSARLLKSSIDRVH